MYFKQHSVYLTKEKVLLRAIRNHADKDTDRNTNFLFFFFLFFCIYKVLSEFKKKKDFICNYVPMCACVCVCGCMCLWKPKEGTGSPGAGIIGRCKPPSMDAEKRTGDIWKSNTHS